MTVNSRSEIPTITAAAAVIDVQDKIAAVPEKVMKHEFPFICAPAFVGILEISGPVNKDHCRAIGVRIARFEQPGIEFDSVPGLKGYHLRLIPGIGPEFFGC